jgi:hypothetical protein
VTPPFHSGYSTRKKRPVLRIASCAIPPSAGAGGSRYGLFLKRNGEQANGGWPGLHNRRPAPFLVVRRPWLPSFAAVGIIRSVTHVNHPKPEIFALEQGRNKTRKKDGGCRHIFHESQSLQSSSHDWVYPCCGKDKTSNGIQGVGPNCRKEGDKGIWLILPHRQISLHG